MVPGGVEVVPVVLTRKGVGVARHARELGERVAVRHVWGEDGGRRPFDGEGGATVDGRVPNVLDGDVWSGAVGCRQADLERERGSKSDTVVVAVAVIGVGREGGLGRRGRCERKSARKVDDGGARGRG